jgi:mRNA interferase YafQ
MAPPRPARLLRVTALRGDYQGFRECHIAPDWLLVYAVDDNQLTAARTGSHSDLF